MDSFAFRMFPAFCLCLGIVFGAAIVACNPDRDPPQACIEALDAGDEAIVMYGDSIDLIDDALNMVLDGEFAAAEVAGRQIGALDPLVEEAVADYDRLSKECRG